MWTSILVSQRWTTMRCKTGIFCTYWDCYGPTSIVETVRDNCVFQFFSMLVIHRLKWMKNLCSLFQLHKYFDYNVVVRVKLSNQNFFTNFFISCYTSDINKLENVAMVIFPFYTMPTKVLIFQGALCHSSMLQSPAASMWASLFKLGTPCLGDSGSSFPLSQQ